LKENKEIIALLQLIDDPDEDVYSTVSNKLISFGKDIIPNLESLWEHSLSQEVQERIELMIHQLHFSELVADFDTWKIQKGSLLEGALLVARYHYPDMQREQVEKDLEKLRRNIWLELNNYLTPFEQTNIVNSIFYSYYKLQGKEIAYNEPENFFINKTLETKKGNAISIGILYLVLCQLLDIPVRAINIPKQFLLAYVDTQHDLTHPHAHNSDKIKFYIDPLNGQIYSHKDVENYFKRIAVPPTTSYFKELSNKRIIQFLLQELSNCFDDELNRYKMKELLSLAKLLDE
jgi:regulator of sirC expression with transglutaminase-like and TPR domain